MATATAKNGRASRVPQIVPEPEQVEGSQLAAAVLRVQALASKLPRNAEGRIGSRTYGYTTLDLVVDEVLPLLVDEDLLWRAAPTIHEGQPALRYRMTHVPSGETDEDVMPLLGCSDSQSLGSATTYDRRYALVAYLNLTVDPDDDGAAASNQAPVDRYAEAEAAAAQSGGAVPAGTQPTAKPAARSERPITANQREKLLKPRARKAGLSAGQFANVILVARGEELRQFRSAEHASQALDFELDRMPARLKDAVLEGIDAAGKAAKS